MKRRKRQPKEKTAQCKNCRRKIHLCGFANKWFHDHNLLTFCMGMAFQEVMVGRGRDRHMARISSAIAEPRTK